MKFNQTMKHHVFSHQTKSSRLTVEFTIHIKCYCNPSQLVCKSAEVHRSERTAAPACPANRGTGGADASPSNTWSMLFVTSAVNYRLNIDISSSPLYCLHFIYMDITQGAFVGVKRYYIGIEMAYVTVKDKTGLRASHANITLIKQSFLNTILIKSQKRLIFAYKSQC